MQITPHIDFGVRKDRLAQTRLRTRPLAPLAAGQVRLEVESFALASKAKKAKKRRSAKGAKGATLLLRSASSKTAYGTAFQLAQRPGVQVVALTRALATSSNFK